MGTARYYAPGAFEPRALGLRGLASLAIAVAAFCALAVFLWLCARDNSFLVRTIGPEHQPEARHSAPAASATASPAQAVETRAVENRDSNVVAAPASKRIPFTVRRSRHFQRFGSVRLGLWRTDAARKLYDLSVVVQGRRINLKGVSLNQAVKINPGAQAAPLELVVNRVSANQISGYLISPAQ